MDSIVAAGQQGPDHSGMNNRIDESSESAWHVLPGGVGSGKSHTLAQLMARMQGAGQGVQGSVQVVFDLKAFVAQPEQVQQTLMELLLTGGTAEFVGDDVAAGE
ncbi:hypothetical protein ABT246_37890 [Streptomyces sp. NPDC001553]|uniref:hypothetical protein n=1 Tax=Streptomyces sp. NPDC001553 TaxID=3154385 RepID=UPI00332E4B3B